MSERNTDPDPSNTADLRTEYEQAGLSRLEPVRNAINRSDEFDSASALTDYFEQKTRDTLMDGDEWYKSHVHRAYQRGITDARNRLEQAGYNPVRTPAPATAMESPAHSRDVSELISRSEHYWQKLENDLMQQARETIRNFARVSAGASVERAQEDEDEDEIINELNAKIGSMAEHRTNLIAEHETAKTHERAMLREYRRNGITGAAIGVRAEAQCVWDNRLCNVCKNIFYEHPYTLEEAENLLPAHPKCRCSWVISAGADTGVPYQ